MLAGHSQVADSQAPADSLTARMRHTAAVRSHSEAPVAHSQTVERADHNHSEERAGHTMAAYSRWAEQVVHIALAAHMDRMVRMDLVVVVHSLMVGRRCRNRRSCHIRHTDSQVAEVGHSRRLSLSRRVGADIHNHPARMTLWLG
jgi:hypothetical protein